MPDTPFWLQLSFALITALAIFGFYRSTKSKTVLIGTLALTALSGVLALVEFYDVPNAMPPRLPVVILPAVIGMLWFFFSDKGRAILDSMDMKVMTYTHTVRVPVELVILGLFMYGAMPESMTFEGRNFDVLSGLTAPLMGYLGYQRKTLSKGALIAWNIVCLALVTQVVVTGIFAAPSVLQQIDFDQPNVAVLYFPYVWLPAVVVPIVMLGHLAAIRALLKK